MEQFHEISSNLNQKISIYTEKLIIIGLDHISPFENYLNDHPKLKKHLTLLVASIALLLDNMLYMAIVPIANTLLEEEGGAKLASNGKYAILFASKALVQLLVNPFSGTLIDTIGYTKPLMLGLMILFTTTTCLSFIRNFTLLVLIRGLQGVGSALADTSAFGLIVDRYQDADIRRRCLGIANACISFGSLISPPFVGFMASISTWLAFTFFSLLSMVNIILLLLHINMASGSNGNGGPVDRSESADSLERALNDVANSGVSHDIDILNDSTGNSRSKNKSRRESLCAAPEVKGTPFIDLIKDPYILVVAGALMIANFPLAFIEPMIGKYMKDRFQSSEDVIGVVWLPSWVPHLLGVFITVVASEKYKHFQWFYGALGMVIVGISGPM